MIRRNPADILTRWTTCALLGVAMVASARPSIAVDGARDGAGGPRVTYYGLHLRFDPVAQTVGGRVSVALVRNQPGAFRLTLDLDSSMVVDSVVADGQRVTVTRGATTLAVMMPSGEHPTAVADVYYHGTPTGDALLFARHGSAPVISSYGLPYSSRAWWPSIDAPSTKADSADIEVTAPSSLTAASNGRFVVRHENGDGTATTRWSVRYPIYPDVIAVAISNYRTIQLAYRDAGGDSLPMPFFVFPEDSAKAQDDFGVLPAMLAHHVARFGPYPFMREKYGVVEMAKQSYREHQTLPGYGARFITGDHVNDRILAHELAHQWFGDALTVRSWSHVWLNEGFATYAAFLWRESTRGPAEYRATVQALMTPEVYDGVVFVADTTDVDHMFTRVTFQKGALVLHMLRHVMGDSAFFGAVRQYVADNLYRTVVTDDFQRAAEQRYGRSLDWFFREWIYHGGAPAYDVRAIHTGRATRGYRVDFDVRQTQDSGVFRMPLDVSLDAEHGSTRLVVWDSLRVQHVSASTPDSVTAVRIDPEGWVVKAVPGGR
jgi:aminopeptidase N